MTWKGGWHFYKKNIGFIFLDNDQLVDFVYSSLNEPDLVPVIWVDLLGSFFHYFKNGNYIQGWTRVLNELDFLIVAGFEIVFVVDSNEVTFEKYETWAKRRKGLLKLDGKITKAVKTKFRNSGPQKGIHRRKNNNQVIRLEKRLDKTRGIDKELVYQECPTLPRNCEAIQAPYEADVLIGMEKENGDFVYTTDSDLLIYDKTSIVIRRRADQWELASREAILEKLQFSTDQFQWACVLGGTDYGSNIPGYSFASAVKAVKGASSFESAFANLVREAGYGQEYEQGFRRALAVFTVGQQTPTLPVLTPNPTQTFNPDPTLPSSPALKQAPTKNILATRILLIDSSSSRTTTTTARFVDQPKKKRKLSERTFKPGKKARKKKVSETRKDMKPKQKRIRRTVTKEIKDLTRKYATVTRTGYLRPMLNHSILSNSAKEIVSEKVMRSSCLTNVVVSGCLQPPKSNSTSVSRSSLDYP
jgi:hypothetical protein